MREGQAHQAVASPAPLPVQAASPASQVEQTLFARISKMSARIAHQQKALRRTVVSPESAARHASFGRHAVATLREVRSARATAKAVSYAAGQQ